MLSLIDASKEGTMLLGVLPRVLAGVNDGEATLPREWSRHPALWRALGRSGYIS
ncbi:hypothetical protein GOOTI_071_00050 [Gordonia otitidis NBRC 100426]|uniref:Uncharacterized protein n=1 Tax=Gordonia otitidis (strain DSM 44809 / CCUG 52243 / JCM 12355 / NBRC 100426 / IFM 10032) TaxID=1108044 RepID=H5TJB8_GORO1|nr:hypothetical protein GOOTI_071_00050 [Gordonia otitidis NBRC 100426]